MELSSRHFPETLPVVVKKGRHQLEELSKAGSRQRWLCPHGKLVAFVDSRGSLKVHDLCSPSIQCTINSHHYTSSIWINKTAQSISQQLQTSHESYLLAVTTFRDLHLYSVEHHPTLHESDEGGGELSALLPFKLISQMSKRQITSILSKAQLGSSLESLYPIGSEEGEIMLLANKTSCLRLFSHSVNHQLSLSAVFSIEPNMGPFEDEVLPHYVGVVTDVCVKWPLLFSVTEDGIVLVYNLINTRCIAAVHPLEYCRMFCSRQPEIDTLLQTISSSTFDKVAVTPDLMKLAVTTKTRHILTVNLSVYFVAFPAHYSNNFRLKPTKHSPPIRRSQDTPPITREEELECLQLGGVTRRHRGLGVNHLGSFVGQYALKKRYKQLSIAINQFSPRDGKRLNLTKTSQLSTHSEIPVRQVSEQKWYIPSNDGVTRSHTTGEWEGLDTFCPTGLKRPRPSAARVDTTPSPARPGSNYPLQCVLPPPEGHVTPDSALLYLEYSNGLVVTYYSNAQTDDMGMGLMEQESGQSPAVNYIIMYKVLDQFYSLAKLSRPSWLILPSNLDRPVYLVSETSISVAAFMLSQEDFVAKVLMYGSAAVAEQVCHINRWDQCSLPLNALETALELRQLDIVSFFLRSRDGTSTSGESESRKESISDPSVSSSSPPPPIPPDQLDAAVNLLSSVINRNHNREHNRQFAGQLLRMTLNFLLMFIKTHSQTEGTGTRPRQATTSDSCDELDYLKSDSGVCEESTGQQGVIANPLVLISPADVTAHIHNLRQYLPKGNLSLDQDEGESDKREGEFEHVLHVMVRKESWEHSTTEEVIQRALVTGDIPLAQSYLIQKAIKGEELPCPQEEISSHAPSTDGITLDRVTSIGMGLVMKALTNKNMKLALSYINQMGADIRSTIDFIFQCTVQRQLRDSLAELMAAENWLTPAETEALDYLHVLELYYPLESYETAKMCYSGGGAVYSTATNSTGNVIDIYPETFGGDQPVVWEPVSVNPLSPTSEKQRGLYIQVPVRLVLEWDSDTRQKVLFDALVLSGAAKGSSNSNLVLLNQQLIYYLSHHDINGASQILDTLPVDMTYQLVTASSCNQYCRDTLLDHVTRNGFPDNENLPNLLYRLGRLHNLLSKPHPLSQGSVQSNYSIEKFHNTFIQYLIEKQFIGLLYMYLDFFKLALDADSITKLQLTPDHIPVWVQLLIQCRLAAQNPTEPERIFNASLACSVMLFKCRSVTEGLKTERILMSLGTLMYLPVPIAEAINPANSHETWSVDEGILRQSLVAYPTLQAAIFPTNHSKLTPSQSQDITLYELLKGTVHFNIARLFKWQRTNKIAAADEDIEATSDLPHFSQPSLTQQSPSSDKLTYTYYLHQGQPSFALANFVAAKIANRSNIKKRIDKAVSKAYKIAINDFSNSRLVASCSAFIEMLSKDSTHLRIDTQSAIKVYDYLKARIDINGKGDLNEQKESIRKRIVDQFLQSPDSHVSSSLLHNLVQATKKDIASNAYASCSVEAENCWSLVQQFCQYHSLPPTTAYLIVCAEEGAWLPLLCHAQLYGISSQEVLSVVEKHFSDPIVKEHLQLAISTMATTVPPVSPALSDASGNGRSKSRHKRKYMGGIPSGKKKPAENKGEGLAPRDVRANFYSRVGLAGHRKENKGSEATPTRVGAGSTPMDSLTAGLMSPVIDTPPLPPPISPEELPDDLLSVLFQCQDHGSHPWRALLAYGIGLQCPLLALLAACYEDSCLIDCMCVWLCATVGSHCLKKVSEALNISVASDDQELHFLAALQWRQWSIEDLGLLLLAAVLEVPSPAGQFSLLFQYFDEHNPLYPFMRFHEEFLLRCDITECKKQLNDFALQMDKCKVQSYPSQVGSSLWVEEVVTTFTNHMIVTCPTPFERIQLYKLLAENGFGQQFTCPRLDFSQLYQISDILDKAGLSSVPAFKFHVEFSPSPSLSHSLLEMYVVRVRMDGLNVLQELVNKGQFGAAKEYAIVADVPISEVTLKEAESKYYKLVGTSYWQYQPARVNFWQQCHRSFINDRVVPEAAVEFFESIVKQSSSITYNERTLLLVLAYQWKKQTDQSFSEEEITRDIWLSHLRAVMVHIKSKGQQPSLPELITDPMLSPTLHSRQLSPTLLPILSSLAVAADSAWTRTSQISQLILPESIPFILEDKTKQSLLDHEELDVLDIVIGRLLNACWITEARELAKLFQYDSPDLTIVLCCIQLAQGKLSTDHLTQEVIDLLANRPPRRSSGPAYILEEGGAKNKMSAEIIGMLQKLSDRANHAHKCCTCIISCFKIAVALHKPYSSIVSSDVFDTLAELLSSLNPDKYSLAKAFVDSTNMQAKEVAGFLSECIAASLQSFIGGEEREYSRVRVYEPHMSTGNFMSLAHLCNDHALLGSHLLSMTRSLSSTEQSSEASLSMQVEMLIRAHDCYSLGCSVDGIAEILKVAHEVTALLYQNKHYKLMVRLLTGVGRFHEMTYIIQLLLECDEFESLVHHGVEKVEQLRVALMEYLRKNCRHDHEKRQMVALKFGMFRELAKTREELAMRDIRRLKHKSLGSDSIQLLKRIFSDLRDAAKIYAQNNCLTSAEQCLSQARLVALQLSLLQSGKLILNMEMKEVHKFMEEQPFSEALIVADAYKQTLLADWVNPLYRRVIIGGNMRYLNEFRAVFTLTPSIIQELASRYVLDRTRPSDSAQNIKKVLMYCPNLSLRHKLVRQLKLSGMDSNFDDGFLKDVAKL